MNASRALEILERSQEKNAIVCLYTSLYSGQFAAGFVECLSEKHVVLRSLTTSGRYDGWLLRQFDDLKRIDYDGRYEEKLQFLYEMRKAQFPTDFMPAVSLGSDLKYEILVAAQHHDYGVYLDTGADEGVGGFVKSVELDCVVIEKFNSFGLQDGEGVLQLEDIEKILVDDDLRQDLKLLARWHEIEPPAW